MAVTGSPLQRPHHSTTTPAGGSSNANSYPRQQQESNPHSSNLLAPTSISAAASVSASSGLLTPASGPSSSSSFVSVHSPNPSPSPSPSPAALSSSLHIDLSGSVHASSPAFHTPSSSSVSIDSSEYQSPIPQDLGPSYRAGDDDDNSDEEARDHHDFGDARYNLATMATWSGQPSVRGGSEAMRMILLNFINIGITFTWGVEMTYCTPYLLDLGLTKSNTSLVWVAGPLSGLLVQPIVGVISDESRSKWGRRRPLMVIGSFIVVACLLVLGFTREIIGIFIKDDQAARMPTIVLAVLAIYVLDFAINAVQSCAKSLVVDTLPIDKQQAGAAWASRLSAVGNVIGYGAGALDLPHVLGKSLGDTQFKQLTLVSTFFYVVTTAITCWSVTERVLVSSKNHEKNQGRFQVFRQIFSRVRNLPPRIQAICWAQFWSWIGWFPFLFYSTTWIGETYFRYDVPADARKSKDTLGAIGRIGSTSLVLYSIITFSSAWVLPLFVRSPEDDSFTHRPPQALAGFLSGFNKMKPDLLTAWMIGHLVFAASMALAPFATSFRFATVLVCLCGIPWTLALWAPVAFLGVEVNKLSSSAEANYHRLSEDQGIEMPSMRSNDPSLHLDRDFEDNSPAPMASTGELSGIYFGILNIYTTLPQFIGTFLSSIVFSILEPSSASSDSQLQSDPEGPNPIAICLFIGAMSTLVAAHMTRRLRFL